MSRPSRIRIRTGELPPVIDTIFYGEIPVQSINYGATPVLEVYHGPNKIWPVAAGGNNNNNDPTN